MLSNDLHLRLHYRETRLASGLISVRKFPIANGTPFWVQGTPRTEEYRASTTTPVTTAPLICEPAPENEIEAQWQALLRLWPCPEELPGCPPSPRPLIEAAMEQPELRRLCPFTRAYTLYFRHSPDDPSTRDFPTAAPIDRDYFQAFAPGSWTPLAEGDAKKVVRMMAEVVAR